MKEVKLKSMIDPKILSLFALIALAAPCSAEPDKGPLNKCYAESVAAHASKTCGPPAKIIGAVHTDCSKVEELYLNDAFIELRNELGDGAVSMKEGRKLFYSTVNRSLTSGILAEQIKKGCK